MEDEETGDCPVHPIFTSTGHVHNRDRDREERPGPFSVVSFPWLSVSMRPLLQHRRVIVVEMYTINLMACRLKA